MQDAAIEQGRPMAELLAHYHRLRPQFMEWTAELPVEQAQQVRVFQRCLVAWYEARLSIEDPYLGDVWLFIQYAATRYFEGVLDSGPIDRKLAVIAPVQHPRSYLPAPIELSDQQWVMHRQLEAMPTQRRELLMLAYYHRIADYRIAELLDMSSPLDAKVERMEALMAVREGWTSAGVMQGLVYASPERFKLVDDFVRGELSVAERWEVDAMRATEPAVRDALLLRQDWDAAIRLLGRQDLMEVLARQEVRYQPAKAVRKVRIPTPTLPEVSIPSMPRVQLPKAKFGIQQILIVLLAGLLLWMLFQTFWTAPGRERLYLAYYQRPDIPAGLSRNDLQDRELLSMLYEYERGNFRTAYDDLLPGEFQYPAVPFYLGISALELNEPERALDWFDRIQPASPYYDMANWYRVLTYLRLDRVIAAENLAIDIEAAPGHPFREQASRLLQEI